MTIAIVGTNGFLGSAFLKTFKDPKFNTQDLIIVSRDISKLTDTETVKHYSFSDLDKVVQIAETLIVLTSATPELYHHFYKLLSTPNKVKLYFPSTWGFEDEAVSSYLPGVIDIRPNHIEAVRKLGIKTVSNANTFFASPNGFLYEYATELVGLYPQTGEVKYIGGGNTEFGVSNPIDIARSVASAISLDEIPNTLKYYSDIITPKQVVAHYIKKHPDFKVLKETDTPYEEALAQARELVASKDYSFFNSATTILHVIVSGGVDKGLLFSESHRELLNPGESKWKWASYEKEQ